MMRTILALLVVAGLAGSAVFLTDNPGRVEILWQGWQIGTSVGVLIGAAALAAIAVFVALWLLRALYATPAAWRRRRRERRRRAGYEALTRGMVAVAAGDPQEAQRHAKRAEVLLAEPPLTLLLSAQAAQIGGDELAAKKFFSAMLERPETEFLGLRGLLNQALRDDDRATARALAERAAALRPDTAWAASSLFDLEARDARWQQALVALGKAQRHRFIAAPAARHHRGAILYELSVAAAASGDRARARTLAAEARGLVPDLALATANYARLLLTDGRNGRAAKIIERAWRQFPHPELAAAYGEIKRDEPLARFARYQRLAAENPAARESHVALAEAAMAARLWGEARRHLEAAIEAEPPPFAVLPAHSTAPVGALPVAGQLSNGHDRATAGLCLIMAQLEEAEHGDPALVRRWLDRAVRALPDPRYICASCGGESSEWHALCRRCGAFDTLAWRTPASRSIDGGLPLALDATPAAVAALPADRALTTVDPAPG
jgi:HemY protein